MRKRVLVLNCGSSSIKFALFDTDVKPMPYQPCWAGKVEGITSAAPTYSETGRSVKRLELAAAQPYHAALEYIRAQVRERLGEDELLAVVHRVVHGGSRYRAPVRIETAVLADLRSYIPLAPLHQPFALEAIETLLQLRPDLPQIACFDTAFHHTLPQVEQLLPLPWAAWERGVRRYGFHGLSYEYIATRLAECDATTPRSATGRTIVAHLGSGASLCAMQQLQSVATTMGFSALDGVMMGTRCGSLDPGAVLYLMEIEQRTLEEVGHLLYHESGLLGVSGVSPDPRELLAQEAGNPRAQAALALYVRRIVREIGALVAVLGGLDCLVFTAGVGEHNAEIRSRICQALGFLRVSLDGEANIQHARFISSAASAVTVRVEPTNEEWIAARHACELLQG